MYIKYIVNCWSVFLYHDVYIKAKVIYFEGGLVARGGFCLTGVLSVPRQEDGYRCCPGLSGTILGGP